VKLKPVSLKGDTATIYLDGTIGGKKIGAPDSESISAASFREQLARVAGAKVIRIEINCEGGVITEGMAIYNAIRACQARTIGVVTGLAASMGSVCLMACDEIVVAKGAFVMIHNPSGGARGGATELRSAAEQLDQMRTELLDIYEARTEIDRAKLEKYLDAETYFSADEAVAAGIADRVEDFEAHVSLQAVARLNPEKVPAALRALATKGKVMKGKNAKIKALEEEAAALKALAAEGDDDEPAEEETDEESETETDDDEEEEEEEKPKDAAAALVALVQTVTGTKSVSKATAKLAGLLSSAGASAATGRKVQVAALVKSGKLLPTLKSWAETCSPSAFKTYVASIGGAQVLKLGATHTLPKAPPVTAPGSEPELTADELKAGKAMGLNRDQMLAAKKQTMVYNGGAK
jgi:ATP-dependent Clp protease, protease subunit